MLPPDGGHYSLMVSLVAGWRGGAGIEEGCLRHQRWSIDCDILALLLGAPT